VLELTQRGVNGSNNMSFVNSPTILGFEADMKVAEFQNNGARPQGRLYAALYNDGTGNSTPGDLTGDVIATVGILKPGTDPQVAFYAVSKCLAPNCNLEGEYQILTEGIFGPVGLNEWHKFSLSWDGSQVTFGLVGSPSVSYTPPIPVGGPQPPKGRKGIGTRVNEISPPNEWGYVSAAFDNVVVTSTGYPLTVTKSGTGTGMVTGPGIDCGSDCGQGYPDGTPPVTLTATPDASSTFAGWSGACLGTGSCLVTMDAAKSVTATFTLQTLTISASVAGDPAGGAR